MGNQLTEIAPNTPFLPGFQSLHIVVIGLDSAGKTSLLYRLKLQEFVETIPTKGFNMERIKMSMGNSKTNATAFQVWDVGGQEKLRPLWKSYTRRTDGLVFVVDAAEIERMEEAKVELHRITRLAENQGVPVLVLANKQDLDGALSASEVIADKGSFCCLTYNCVISVICWIKVKKNTSFHHRHHPKPKPAAFPAVGINHANVLCGNEASIKPL